MLHYQRDGYAAEQLLERGLKPPQWYLDEPEFHPHTEFFFRSFWDLNTERQIGMALGSIPASRILECAERHGFSEDVTEMFVRSIRAMDAAYLDWQNQESTRLSKMKSKGKVDSG